MSKIQALNAEYALVDDMFLVTDIYSPAGTTFRIRPADLTAHVSWVPTVNSRLNSGSAWFPETGHNGNGNIEVSSVLVQSYYHD